MSKSPKTKSPIKKSPEILIKLQLPKTTEAFDSYWKFAFERQEVFYRRLAGLEAPWSQNPVLAEFKFTNTYRASDRVSQYLIKNVIYSGSQAHDEVFFRTLLFKIFNRIDTWELLTSEFGEVSYKEFTEKRYGSILGEAMANGERIYSAAYIMPSGSGVFDFSKKYEMHLHLLNLMMKERLPTKIANAKSLGEVFSLIKSYPTIGDFLAFQYAIDINYSQILNFSEMDFVVPGPGAKDGIRKCFSTLGDFSEVDIIKYMADIQVAQFDRLGLPFRNLWGRDLQLIDCQNIFCETDKYCRVMHPDIAGISGRTKIKQKFRTNGDLTIPWYPPKWKINDKIAKMKPSQSKRKAREFISEA